MRAIAALGILAALGLAAGPARAGDRALVRAVDVYVPSVRAAAAEELSPESAQRRYDAARDLAEALRGAGRVSAGCGSFRAAADALAAAEIEEADGFDNVSSGRIRAGARAAAGAQTRLAAARPRCVRASAHAAPPPALRRVGLLSPQTDAVVPGRLHVAARGPAGALWATIALGAGRLDCRRRLELGPGRRVSLTIALRPGRHDVRVGFCAARGLVAIDEARGVWVLPKAAALRLSAERADPGGSARAAAVARTFPGYAGVWFHDLGSGRTARWNESARFPAASTVKLAVLVAALRRFGPRAETSRAGYDLEAMVERSSNLATNRLLVALGGSQGAGAAAADRVLKELGAPSSTFTGGYRVGTSAGRVTGEPPHVSGRVTTARDLGRILLVVHAAAIRGDHDALRRLGVSWHEAQVALNLLLSSDLSLAANAGLVRPALRPSTPVAQKNGWLADARHTAAIVYAPTGPKIVVLLTYRPKLSLAAAQALGREILRALRL